jgi:hypothetical protein
MMKRPRAVKNPVQPRLAVERVNPPLEQREASSRLAELAEQGFNCVNGKRMSFRRSAAPHLPERANLSRD